MTQTLYISLPLCFTSQSLFFIHSFFQLYVSCSQPLSMFGPVSLCLVCFSLFSLGVSPTLFAPRASARELDGEKVSFDDLAGISSQRGCFYSVSSIFLLPPWISLCFLFRFNIFVTLLSGISQKNPKEMQTDTHQNAWMLMEKCSLKRQRVIFFQVIYIQPTGEHGHTENRSLDTFD